MRIASRAHFDAIKTNVSEHANVDTGVVKEDTAFSGVGACSVEKEAARGTVVLYALTTPLSDPTNNLEEQQSNADEGDDPSSAHVARQRLLRKSQTCILASPPEA